MYVSYNCVKSAAHWGCCFIGATSIPAKRPLWTYIHIYIYVYTDKYGQYISATARSAWRITSRIVCASCGRKSRHSKVEATSVVQHLAIWLNIFKLKYVVCTHTYIYTYTHTYKYKYKSSFVKAITIKSHANSSCMQLWQVSQILPLSGHFFNSHLHFRIFCNCYCCCCSALTHLALVLLWVLVVCCWLLCTSTKLPLPCSCLGIRWFRLLLGNSCLPQSKQYCEKVMWWVKFILQLNFVKRECQLSSVYCRVSVCVWK